MNVDKEFLDVDLAWKCELVYDMPQDCVGQNIAHVSVTRLLVHCGTIYRIR